MPTVSFQAPTDYTAEQSAIERQRRLAEALRMQSEQPLDTNQMAGGWVVPVSPYAGLAKMLQGYNARKTDENATERELALAERRRMEGSADVRTFMDALQGTPAREAQTTAEPGNDFIPGQEAVPGDRKKALAIALMSQNPTLMGAGGSILAEMLKGPESLFSKIDPKDYTPESVRIYATTKDPATLVPVRKMDAVNTGGTTQFINPYAPPAQPIPHTQTPDSVARLQQAERQFNSLSAKQQLDAQFDAARLGISVQELLISRANAANKGIETNFNTGGGVVPGMPTLPQIPQIPQAGQQVPAAAPQMPIQAPQVAPQVAPQGRRTGVYATAPAAPSPVPPPAASPSAPRFSPRVQQELDKDNALKNQDAARELPQAIATANQAITSIDDMIGDLDKGGKTAPHPGFQDVIGSTWKPGMRFVPGTDAADFDARLEQLKGKTFMQAYQSLRGGGQITEVEGDKATKALNRMSRAQSEKEFITAAREFQQNMRLGMELAAQKAGRKGTAGASGSWDGTDRRSPGKVIDFNSLPKGGG